MANTLSAKKNVRKSQRKQRQNRNASNRLKKQVKEFLNKPSVEKQRTLQKSVDKAAGRGLIKKNKARRLNSRISRVLKSLK